MNGFMERRYWLSGMPEGDFGSGIRIRYVYLDITEDEYRLRMADGHFFIGRVDESDRCDVEIDADAFDLLDLARKNTYRQQIRFAMQVDHQRYVVDEETLPEGAYNGHPIVEGEVYWVDQGVEVRQKGETSFIARRLANRPVWEGGDVSISQEVFAFFQRSASCFQVEKTRFEITTPADRNVDARVWHVDRYDGPLEGLFRARVILPEDVIGVLPVPIAEVAFRDVTHDVRFQDWHLARHGLVRSPEEALAFGGLP